MICIEICKVYMQMNEKSFIFVEFRKRSAKPWFDPEKFSLISSYFVYTSIIHYPRDDLIDLQFFYLTNFSYNSKKKNSNLFYRKNNLSKSGLLYFILAFLS